MYLIMIGEIKLLSYFNILWINFFFKSHVVSFNIVKFKKKSLPTYPNLQVKIGFVKYQKLFKKSNFKIVQNCKQNSNSSFR